MALSELFPELQTLFGGLQLILLEPAFYIFTYFKTLSYQAQVGFDRYGHTGTDMVIPVPLQMVIITSGLNWLCSNLGY